MGSLFKGREWWSTRMEDDEGFDVHSMVICNVDNAPDGKGKLVVGSLKGILRVFSLTEGTNSTGAANGLNQFKPSDLLLEADVSSPILQIESGRFLPASQSVNLLILCPKKISVISIAGSVGLSDHGSSYNILPLYEHLLQRSPYNLVIGPFGQVKGRDFICVQSLDGTLSFYEQESFAFSRFLPNYLLPGPIDYNPVNDSFLVATASKSVESYRYQIIAIAKEDESSSAPDHQRGRLSRTQSVETSVNVRGRRVISDWSIVTGETILDLKVVTNDKKGSLIAVLGERNMFLLKDTGIIVFVKKLDFTPTCFTSYFHLETIMTLIVTENSTLLVYSHNILKWASQMPFTPIAIQRATVSTIQGVIVILSDSGDLSCCYLGTNPSISPITLVNPHDHIINYEESEKELAKLKKIIKSFNDTDLSSFQPNKPTMKSFSGSTDLSIVVTEFMEFSQEIDSYEQIGNNLVKGSAGSSENEVSFKIQLVSSIILNEVRLMIDLPNSFQCTERMFVIPKLETGVTTQHIITVSLERNMLPDSMTVSITVIGYTPVGSPRVFRQTVDLPLSLICKVTSSNLSIEADCPSLTLDVTSQSTIKLKDLLPELFASPFSSDTVSSVGIEFFPHTSPVAMSFSLKSGHHRLLMRSSSYDGVSFMGSHLINRLQKVGVKFDTATLNKKSLPIRYFFSIIDEHFDLRTKVLDKKMVLGDMAAQYRTIQKRFLIKMKDRNPAPLNQVDSLIHYIHSKILKETEEMISLQENLQKVSNILCISTKLVVKMIAICTNMKQEQLKQLSCCLSGEYSSDFQEFWEERMELSIADFLDEKTGGLTSKPMDPEMLPADDTNKVKMLISRLVDMAFKGDIVSNAKPTSLNTMSPTPLPGARDSHFLNPATQIIPEEDEE